jgi:hypothetical protein
LIVKSDNIEVNNVCPSKDTTIEMKMQSKKWQTWATHEPAKGALRM